MDWQNFLIADVKPLASHLTLEKVRIDREGTKLLICFLSDVLVKEKAYLQLKHSFQNAFPSLAVSLRVCSPALSQSVRDDIMPYTPFIIDCLARTSPGVRPWLMGATWKLTGDKLMLTIPSEVTLSYIRKVELDKRLTELMHDVFRMQLTVGFICEEDEKAQRDRLSLLEEKAEEALRLQRQHEAQQAQNTSKANSNRLYGSAIKESETPIGELTDASGTVAIRGEVIDVETKELKGGEMRLVSFLLTDYTGSISCKLFLRYKRRFPAGEEKNVGSVATAEEIARVDAVTAGITKGGWLTVRGDCQNDKFAREVVLMVNAIDKAEAPKREDTADQKRVELHLHTQMSNMDAVSSATELIKQAAAWGHPAVAITDHGVVQAFPEAFAAAKKYGIKLIPGMEGYLVDEVTIVENPDDRLLTAPIVVIDFETTGLAPRHDYIIEIGAVRIVGDQIVDELSLLIDPGIAIPQRITEITGITTAMVRGQLTFKDVAQQLLDFIGDAALAAHNASFDLGFLRASLLRCGLSWKGPVIDTLSFARKAYPTLKTHRLGSVCRHLGIKLKDAHRAVHDARATAQMLQRMIGLVRAKDVETLKELNFSLTGGAVGASYHIILLACSQTGMTNLNRLVSEAHLHHFRQRPLLPRSEVQKYREGIIVGSACESGELFQAVLEGKDDKSLSQIARYYDYLEIQPIDNNEFLLRNQRVKSIEELRDMNRKIVALGEKLGLPVVATGDVHFMRPQDATFRAILMAGKGFENADEQPPLYFKTTDEMLEAFAYLGPEKAQEVVVTNPNRIAGKVSDVRLFPKHPEGKETFQPYWEDANDTIRNTCYKEAHRRYGENLPAIVSARIEKELSSIITYGFATLYSIAQKLVRKSLSDGYLVGSRGSVGSSFVATLCGITEVNPLPPHYLCPACYDYMFDETHEIAAIGVDLPEKECPVCGAAYMREGYDIPFEVFLGFEGDKVPDIDLNFSGVYQPQAHKYVEELFGASNVFRAGTIGTLAEKTAYGYVSKYLEERTKVTNEAEKNRLVKGCVGVKRTTGQHPGGIVVLPTEYTIYQFTAIQRPADDVNSPIVTTHYDFSSMHDVLVKLDILGHDDPTMIHMLQQLTGVDPFTIQINDPAVMSLFQSPEALGVSEKDIRCSTGTLGIPEFGTAFVRGMLDDTKPKTIEELIRISGLSHGTDVWLGNAADLIASGTATLRECICTRDDIMNTLMLRGMEPKTAFDIMEAVRKGKGLTPSYEQAMHGVETPQWYIDSCKKIKYMFPKAHASAYVMMALRIAWFKIYYPGAYYTAYYTVRADAFDINLMRRDANELRELLDDFDMRYKELTAAEKEQIVLVEIALEMAMRGITLLPVDLYASDAEAFQLTSEGILPPFTAIPGVGLTAAESLRDARKAGQYLSIEDVKLRTKVSGTVMDALRAQGALMGLAEMSQVSFF